MSVAYECYHQCNCGVLWPSMRTDYQHEDFSFRDASCYNVCGTSRIYDISHHENHLVHLVMTGRAQTARDAGRWLYSCLLATSEDGRRVTLSAAYSRQCPAFRKTDKYATKTTNTVTAVLDASLNVTHRGMSRVTFRITRRESQHVVPFPRARPRRVRPLSQLPPALLAKHPYVSAHLAISTSYHPSTHSLLSFFKMQRPGPLRDWALERFDTESNTVDAVPSPFKQPGSSKRPLSPEGSLPAGPKRRLLDTRLDTTSRRTARSSTAPCQPIASSLKRFIQKPILRPVRVQVFTRSHGSLKGIPGDSGSCAPSSSKSRCTSAPPCLSPSRSTRSHNIDHLHKSSLPMDVDEVECLLPPSPLSIQLDQDSAWPHSDYHPSYDNHDPGFDIYRDSVGEILTPLFGTLFAGGEFSPVDANELDKENSIPRPAERVTFGAPSCGNPWLKAGLLSPQQLYGDNGADHRPTPVTPLAQRLCGTSLAQQPSTTPGSRHARLPGPLVTSPTSQRRSLEKQELVERKRLLEDEADGMDWLEDEERL